MVEWIERYLIFFGGSMVKKVSQKKARLTVSLKDETLEKLEEVSNNLGITKSGVIELALKNYFRNK